MEFAHETQKMWEQVVTTAFPLLERRCRQETMLQQSSRSLIDSGGGWIGARRYPMKDLKAGKKLLIPFLRKGDHNTLLRFFYLAVDIVLNQFTVR